MAISSRAAACAALAFPSTAAAAAPPSSVSVNRRARPRKALAAVARATSAGGAVLDPPAFDQSQLDTLPPAQEGGDTGRLKDRKGTGSGDSYKVLLLDDPRHTEKHGTYPFLLLLLQCFLMSRWTHGWPPSLPPCVCVCCDVQWRRRCRRWCRP
uniref:Photosystem II 10 kDa polypeptide, chloroplastic n=1 Tax=Triticum urartu TaxID=4572 RepID=A0A8R7TZI5_TRIUA